MPNSNLPKLQGLLEEQELLDVVQHQQDRLVEQLGVQRLMNYLATPPIKRATPTELSPSPLPLASALLKDFFEEGQQQIVRMSEQREFCDPLKEEEEEEEEEEDPEEQQQQENQEELSMTFETGLDSDTDADTVECDGEKENEFETKSSIFLAHEIPPLLPPRRYSSPCPEIGQASRELAALQQIISPPITGQFKVPPLTGQGYDAPFPYPNMLSQGREERATFIFSVVDRLALQLEYCLNRVQTSNPLSVMPKENVALETPVKPSTGAVPKLRRLDRPVKRSHHPKRSFRQEQRKKLPLQSNQLSITESEFDLDCEFGMEYIRKFRANNVRSTEVPPSDEIFIPQDKPASERERHSKTRAGISSPPGLGSPSWLHSAPERLDATRPCTPLESKPLSKAFAFPLPPPPTTPHYKKHLTTLKQEQQLQHQQHKQKSQQQSQLQQNQELQWNQKYELVYSGKDQKMLQKQQQRELEQRQLRHQQQQQMQQQKHREYEQFQLRQQQQLRQRQLQKLLQQQQQQQKQQQQQQQQKNKQQKQQQQLQHQQQRSQWQPKLLQQSSVLNETAGSSANYSNNGRDVTSSPFMGSPLKPSTQNSSEKKKYTGPGDSQIYFQSAVESPVSNVSTVYMGHCNLDGNVDGQTEEQKGKSKEAEKVKRENEARKLEIIKRNKSKYAPRATKDLRGFFDYMIKSVNLKPIIIPCPMPELPPREPKPPPERKFQKVSVPIKMDRDTEMKRALQRLLISKRVPITEKQILKPPDTPDPMACVYYFIESSPSAKLWKKQIEECNSPTCEISTERYNEKDNRKIATYRKSDTESEFSEYSFIIPRLNLKPSQTDVEGSDRTLVNECSSPRSAYQYTNSIYGAKRCTSHGKSQSSKILGGSYRISSISRRKPRVSPRYHQMTNRELSRRWERADKRDSRPKILTKLPVQSRSGLRDFRSYFEIDIMSTKILKRLANLPCCKKNECKPCPRIKQYMTHFYRERCKHDELLFHFYLNEGFFAAHLLLEKRTWKGKGQLDKLPYEDIDNYVLEYVRERNVKGMSPLKLTKQMAYYMIIGYCCVLLENATHTERIYERRYLLRTRFAVSIFESFMQNQGLNVLKDDLNCLKLMESGLHDERRLRELYNEAISYASDRADLTGKSFIMRTPNVEAFTDFFERHQYPRPDPLAINPLLSNVRRYKQPLEKCSQDYVCPIPGCGMRMCSRTMLGHYLSDHCRRVEEMWPEDRMLFIFHANAHPPEQIFCLCVVALLPHKAPNYVPYPKRILNQELSPYHLYFAEHTPCLLMYSQISMHLLRKKPTYPVPEFCEKQSVFVFWLASVDDYNPSYVCHARIFSQTHKVKPLTDHLKFIKMSEFVDVPHMMRKFEGSYLAIDYETMASMTFDFTDLLYIELKYVRMSKSDHGQNF